MSYTLQQLQSMGAKPVANTTDKKSYTLDELKSMNAKPVEEKSLGRKVGDFFTSSTQALGNNLGQRIHSKEGLEQFNQASQAYTNISTQLLKAIKTKKALGGDVTSLSNELQRHINEAPKLENFLGGQATAMLDNSRLKNAEIIGGQVLGTALEASGGGLLSAGAKSITSKTLSTGQKLAQGSKIGAGYGAATGLSDAMQQGGNAGQLAKQTAIGGTLGAGLGLGVEVLGTGTIKTAKKIGQLGKSIIDTTDKKISGLSDSGIVQAGKEFAERGPRALRRVKEKATDMNLRANEIKNATPEIANAMKSNLDERIINTVSQADNETKKAFKDVLDIADESPKTIGTKKQPSIVGGELAVKQYDIIDKNRKEIGKAIEEEVKKLPKDFSIDMSPSYRKMDEVLSEIGVLPINTKNGIVLDFSESGFSNAQRTKIKELYKRATETGSMASPKVIHSKDRMFSQLKRESSSVEKIGDIIVNTPEGQKSLFDVFRDVYRQPLDDVSETMRELNKKYAKAKTLTTAIEDTLLKGGAKYNGILMDDAQFAKVNLRRIFGEAQSSPAFEAVADIMDKASRGLGYKGATPKEVAEFAEYLRKLYPESIPKTGFQGGIKLGLSDILEQISKIGAPNVADQKKALRELLNVLSKK